MNFVLTIGWVLIACGVWVFFSSTPMQISDDSAKITLFGYFGTAIYRVFSKASFTEVESIEKKAYAIIFIAIGILCIYSEKLIN